MKARPFCFFEDWKKRREERRVEGENYMQSFQHTQRRAKKAQCARAGYRRSQPCVPSLPDQWPRTTSHYKESHFSCQFFFLVFVLLSPADLRPEAKLTNPDCQVPAMRRCRRCLRLVWQSMMSWCLMSSDVIWHIRDKLWPMPKHGSIKSTYVRCMRV